jgi:hypothetical protein
MRDCNLGVRRQGWTVLTSVSCLARMSRGAAGGVALSPAATSLACHQHNVAGAMRAEVAFGHEAKFYRHKCSYSSHHLQGSPVARQCHKHLSPGQHCAAALGHSLPHCKIVPVDRVQTSPARMAKYRDIQVSTSTKRNHALGAT